MFEDFKADPGEKSLFTFRAFALEGAMLIGTTLSAIRLPRMRYETSILLYGPGVTMRFRCGFPTLGDEVFPGRLCANPRLAKFMEKSENVNVRRFLT